MSRPGEDRYTTLVRVGRRATTAVKSTMRITKRFTNGGYTRDMRIDVLFHRRISRIKRGIKLGVIRGRM